jgi:tetratricopeptide (TPR) repeat protein
MSLNNLAAFLSELGDREAALNAAREAVDLYRALAAQRPDAFRPDLAMSLNNLANHLGELGDREAALTAAREAVDIRRALAAQRPDAFRPDLAVSLRVFADCLESEDLAGALAATIEACQLHATLFVARPALFASQMAKTAGDYVARCERAGQEPDKELLAPIIALFEKLHAS